MDSSKGTMTLVEPLTVDQISALPVYEWDVARIGDWSPPLTYQVTDESIADYCEAVRNNNPLHFDPVVAAGGPVRRRHCPTDLRVQVCAPAAQ